MPGVELLPSAPMPTSAKQDLSEGYTSILFPHAVLRQVTVIQEGEKEGATRIFKVPFAWFYYYSVSINGLNKEGKYPSFNLCDIRQED